MIRHELVGGQDYLMKYTVPGGFVRMVIVKYHDVGDGGFEIIPTKFIRTKKVELDDNAEWVKIDINKLFDQCKNTGD